MRLTVLGTTTTLQASIELNGNIWRWLTNGCHVYMCDEYQFQLLNTTKMKSAVTVRLCPERVKYVPLLSVRESVVTFH